MIPVMDSIPSRNTPIAMYGIILVNALVFFFEIQLPTGSRDQLFYVLGLVPARYTHPAWAQFVGFAADDYWPFLTSMFLHGGWLHIIGNMWMLYIFGDNVEDRMGPVGFLAFYLLCGIAAAVVHTWTNPTSTIPTVGASGAVAGVMGAYFVLFPRAQVVTLIPIFFYPLFVAFPAFVFIGMWAFIQFYNGTLSIWTLDPNVGGIAWWAHVGGFAAGVILCGFFARPARACRRCAKDEVFWELPWVRER